VIAADLPQPTAAEAYSYRVYLPPCYEADSGYRYPVLYLIPGSKSSPDSWLKAGLAAEMDRLILGKKVPPLIVVITTNTDADLQGETILNELLPAVENEYPIAQDRRYRSVAGASLGGFSAYSMAFQNPAVFCCVALFGAGLAQGDEIRVRLWISQMDDSNRTRVFMNSGTEDPYMLERAQAMKSLLDDTGTENQLLVDESGHHYKYWIPNFETYLSWLSKDW
jgi:enterochelin esterase-like enzyme